ncbi:hypothetical protein BJX66DRAFT_316234 [Aspergillus keveii]|uniref:Uncharacterized protein n=1 Tax=Aspergillus keveii TaxID=714993 RepID=A0ABR4FP21_9EURO
MLSPRCRNTMQTIRYDKRHEACVPDALAERHVTVPRYGTLSAKSKGLYCAERRSFGVSTAIDRMMNSRQHDQAINYERKRSFVPHLARKTQPSNMVDIGGIVGYTTTTGIEALRILNKWLDSKETAAAWYGKFADDFLKPRNAGIKLLRKKYAIPEIANVFTIQKEDWQVVMEGSLPAAHTWYRKRKDEAGECSWLPLYWACRDQLSKERVLQKADVALASIGLVSGLPAARLDLWGLIVMAYSNGARARVTTAEGGGFNATLLCRHFIVTISQGNVNAPTIGHLEPREHPSESHESLTVDESRYLLDYGHTFSPKGVTTAWVLNGQNCDPPPAELVESRSDPLLAKTVLDTFQASALKDKFHLGMIEYWEEWAKFMAPMERNGSQDSLATQIEPWRAAETTGHVCSTHVKLDNNVVSEMQTLQELETEIGMLSYDPEQSDDDHLPLNGDQPPGNNHSLNHEQSSNNPRTILNLQMVPNLQMTDGLHATW